MLYDHAHAMQVKLCKANTRGVTLSVLPIDKYGHIVTVLHQGDLSAATPTQILGRDFYKGEGL